MKNAIIEVDGKFYQKAKVVMLPTEKASHVHFVTSKDNIGDNYENKDGKLIPLKTNKLLYADQVTEYGFPPRHLYFLSEEEPKVGEWGYNKELNIVGQISLNSDKSEWKKIIATTDESLVDNPGSYDAFTDKVWNQKFLPRPSDDFLQAYCKANGKINGVLVEYESDFSAEVQFIGKTQTTPIYPYKLKVSPDNTITIKPITQLSPEEKFEIDNALQDKFDEGYVHRMNDEKDMHTKEEMFLNMQYYMEHCQLKGYVTPQDWLKNHKHF